MDVKTDVMKKLQNAGYILRENKSELFKKETVWIGHKSDQNGSRMLRDLKKNTPETD